jgi:hypothetical protein
MKSLKNFILLLGLFLVSLQTLSQIEIILKKSFVAELKNKVTVDVNYNIMFAHKRPNAASKDGDMHIAGTAESIRLPVVAEIMNAADEDDAVALVHQMEGSGKTVKMTGVWRLWCEHAANGELQEQDAEVTIENTNPPHAFEIHPVLSIGEFDLTGSLKPIEGFTYKEADAAFAKYMNASCKLEDLGDLVKITTQGFGFNYAEFWIELADNKPYKSDDGTFAYCSVLNENQECLVSKMRMVFPKGSAAEKKLKTMSKGDVLHVVGVPRIDLALIDYRLKNAAKKPEMLTWNLPVEMIVVAKLP